MSIDLDAARASYDDAWVARFDREIDESGLRGEDNLLRYRPLRHVLVRVGADAPSGALDAALAAARRCATPVTVSRAEEPLDALIAGLETTRPARLRLLGTSDGTNGPGHDDLLRACHRLDIAVDTNPVSADGWFELIHWLHEQAVSVTRHRYGRITR